MLPSGKQVNGKNEPQTAASGKHIPAAPPKIKSYRYLIKYWIPVIFMMGIIFFLSSGIFTSGYTSRFFFPTIHSLFPRLSWQGVSLIHELIRALAHIAEYFFIGLLLSHAFYRNSGQIWNLKRSVKIIILLTLLALSDEFFQSFFPLRKSSLADVGLDLIGVILSQVAVINIYEFITHNSKQAMDTN